MDISEMDIGAMAILDFQYNVHFNLKKIITISDIPRLTLSPLFYPNPAPYGV
jgi:hypothetical protein